MKCKTCFGIKSKFVKMESIPTRASGEIGRRARLRSVWSKILGGSSPLSPTNVY